jgi:hypothetical protein
MRNFAKIMVATLAIISCSTYETPILIQESKSKIVEAETSRNEVGINDIYSVLRRDYPNSKSSIEESFMILRLPNKHI